VIWEIQCRRAVRALGFESVPSWECLCKHKQRQLFIPIYVDDLQLAGKKSSMAKTWADLGKHLDLDPPVGNSEAVYLGCYQRNVPSDPEMVRQRNELFRVQFCDVTSQVVDAVDIAVRVLQKGVP